jgi:hypothetical protein
MICIQYTYHDVINASGRLLVLATASLRTSPLNTALRGSYGIIDPTRLLPSLHHRRRIPMEFAACSAECSLPLLTGCPLETLPHPPATGTPTHTKFFSNTQSPYLLPQKSCCLCFPLSVPSHSTLPRCAVACGTCSTCRSASSSTKCASSNRSRTGISVVTIHFQLLIPPAAGWLRIGHRVAVSEWGRYALFYPSFVTHITLHTSHVTSFRRDIAGSVCRDERCHPSLADARGGAVLRPPCTCDLRPPAGYRLRQHAANVAGV